MIDKQNNKKRKVSSKVYDSDEDEHGRVALLTKCVEECQTQACDSNQFIFLFLCFMILHLCFFVIIIGFVFLDE